MVPDQPDSHSTRERVINICGLLCGGPISNVTNNVGDKLLLVIASFLTNFESDCVNGDEVMIKIRNLIKNLCAGEIFDD